jgi:hypothetical protein
VHSALFIASACSAAAWYLFDVLAAAYRLTGGVQRAALSESLGSSADLPERLGR